MNFKFHKTLQSQRSTYKYFNEDDHLIVELKPGKDGITEADIANLHHMDDHEVYINNKCCHFPEWYQKDIDAAKSKYIANFKKIYGYEPRPTEVKMLFSSPHTSIEKAMESSENSDGYGDKSHLLEELASYDFKEESDAVIRLQELISSMPENWQEIYQQVVIEGIPMTQVATARDVSEAAIRKTMNKIKTRIASDKNLKNLCK